MSELLLLFIRNINNIYVSVYAYREAEKQWGIKESIKMVDHDMSVGHAHLTNFLNLFQAWELF